MGHHQLLLIIHLQHRLAAQPIDQFVGVRRFQQRRDAIFGFVAANAGVNRQQVQIVVAQHHAHRRAERAHIAQHVQRGGAARHQIAGQPQLIALGIESSLSQQRLQFIETAVNVADKVCRHS